jgi:hypothetical protein
MLSDDVYNRFAQSMSELARWWQIRIVDGEARARVDAIWEREGGRIGVGLTSEAGTYATGLEMVLGRPRVWVLPLRLGDFTDRNSTMDAIAMKDGG